MPRTPHFEARFRPATQPQAFSSRLSSFPRAIGTTLLLCFRARSVLKALQRRYVLLEESSKLVCDALKATKAAPALEAMPLFLEIRRAAR